MLKSSETLRYFEFSRFVCLTLMVMGFHGSGFTIYGCRELRKKKNLYIYIWDCRGVRVSGMRGLKLERLCFFKCKC